MYQNINEGIIATYRRFQRCLIMHKCLNNNVDFKFNFQYSPDIYSYNTQHKPEFELTFRIRQEKLGETGIQNDAANDRNSLPVKLWEIFT